MTHHEPLKTGLLSKKEINLDALGVEESPPDLPPRPQQSSAFGNSDIQNDYAPEHQLPIATRLTRSSWILYLVLFYTALAMTAWVLICFTSRQPIGFRGYGVDRQWLDSHPLRNGEPTLDEEYAYFISGQFVQAARVMQAAVAVLTIPVVSATCSQAAVVYLQWTGERGKNPTLRQAMVLADRCWTEPVAIAKLLMPWNRRRQGSMFLLLAVVLTVIGATISPLQTLLLSYHTVQVPATQSSSTITVKDLTKNNITSSDMSFLLAMMRNKLSTTTRYDAQFNLWSRANPNIQSPTHDVESDAGFRSTLQDLTYLYEAFWSPAPSNFHSGVLSQFSPRINSSANSETVNLRDMPAACTPRTDALVLNYYKPTEMQFCVINKEKAWNPLRTTQSMVEELYVFSGSLSDLVMKVTLKTTFGYFELPNYSNGMMPGPLLDMDPEETCRLTGNCLSQWQSGGDVSEPSSAANLQFRGLLALIVEAAFGRGSVLDDGRESSSYANDPDCSAMLPFVVLANDKPGSQCVRGGLDDSGKLDYIQNLFKKGGSNSLVTSTSVLDAVAFIAADVWMSVNPGPTLDLNQLNGKAMLVPSITNAGMVALSALLGLHLTCLVILAAIATVHYRWTPKLDSFAMIRIGASRARQFPLWLAYSPNRVGVLDDVPGWVGHKGESNNIDGIDLNSHAAEIELGSHTSMNHKLRYRCYEGDDDLWGDSAYEMLPQNRKRKSARNTPQV